MTLRRFVCAILFLAAPSLFGDVDVRLTTPRERFDFGGVTSLVTNDPILRLEGEIRSDGGDAILSVETPAGVPRLDAIEAPLRYIVVDLGKTPRAVTDIVFAPVVETVESADRSYGARAVAVSASRDGRAFDAPRLLNVPSGVVSLDRTARAQLPSATLASRIKIEFLDGWQRSSGKPNVSDIRLMRVGVVGDDGAALPSEIAQIGVLFAGLAPVEPFRFHIRLREGRNNVAVTAAQLGREELPIERRADSLTLTAILQSEIPRTADDKEPFVLSDGSHLILTIPRGASDETLRAVHFDREPSDAIPSASYASNRLIRPGSAPILAIRFSGRYQTAFRAEATASLPGQPPSLAVDGRREFPSTWVSNLTPMPIRWKVNLENAVALGKIVVVARKDGATSYAPKRAQVRVSSDDATYVPVVGQIGSNPASETLTAFDDGTTTVLLPTNPTAQWVELLIEEGKQANNVQINEIEFYDASGGRILALSDVPRVSFAEPVGVILRYYSEDLAAADAPDNSPVGAFLWNDTTSEWEWTRAIARSPDKADAKDGGYFALDLNVLTRLAVFPLASAPKPTESVSVRWSHNPFSPNGDGVSDTTRLTVELETPQDADSATTPDVTVNLYDLRSMLVKTLSDRAVVSSNALVIEWDGTDRDERRVPIGPYIYEVVVRRNGSSRNDVVVRNGLLVVAR